MTPLGVGFVALEIRLHKDAGEGESNQSRLFSHLSASFLAALFVIGVSQFELDGLNGILIDAQFRAIFWKRPHPAIALVAYDDKSSNRYYGSPKIPVVEIEKVLGWRERRPPLHRRLTIVPMPKPGRMTAIAAAAAISSTPPSASLRHDRREFRQSPDDSVPTRNHSFSRPFISRDNFSYGAGLGHPPGHDHYWWPAHRVRRAL
ncbi:MAG: hypothetical protein R3B54_19025 [Bdellovibrionota bacterium]